MRFLSIILFVVLISLIGCKDEDCFDAQLKENHSGVCTEDCPGICGCDGNTYCNECIANSQGIALVSEKACGSSASGTRGY